MFSLQDLGGGGGLAGVSESRGGTGILSALENIGVNFAAGAATVGLSAIGKAAGVSPVYSNPAALAYNSSLLTRPPGSVSPVVTDNLLQKVVLASLTSPLEASAT